MRARHVATSMSRRTWLVSVSIGAHFAIGLGLFASGIWMLERLESDSRIAAIGVMTQSQAGGGPGDLPEPKLEKKQKEVEKKVVTDVQWDPKVKRPDVEAEKKSSTGDGEGEGDETGKGLGKGPGDGEHTTGTCVLPPCAQPEVPKLPEPPPAPPKMTVIPPSVMGPLRIAGETQIHPPRAVKNQILADGKNRIVGTVKVCIGTSGAITSVSMLSSTKYPEYDAQLLSSVRSWRYRPYMVDGVPQPACSPVSFVYSIK